MQFEPESTALVLIEYQNEWVSAQGSLRQKLVVEEKQFEHAIESSKLLLICATFSGHFSKGLFKVDR